MTEATQEPKIGSAPSHRVRETPREVHVRRNFALAIVAFEVPMQLVDLRPGAWVRHRPPSRGLVVVGEGVVVDHEGEMWLRRDLEVRVGLPVADAHDGVHTVVPLPDASDLDSRARPSGQLCPGNSLDTVDRIGHGRVAARIIPPIDWLDL
jgi:hypothetical protein